MEDKRWPAKALFGYLDAVAETWRRVWGDGNFFADQDFLNDVFFGKNVHFHGQNIRWTFFSHWPGFSDFPFLFPDFSYLLLCSMSYMTISSQEQPLFLKNIPLCSYFRANSIILLLKILLRPMHGPSPTSNFGGPFPQPLGLRPCLDGKKD